MTPEMFSPEFRDFAAEERSLMQDATFVPTLEDLRQAGVAYLRAAQGIVINENDNGRVVVLPDLDRIKKGVRVNAVDASTKLIAAALRCVLADRADEHANADAEAQYAYEQLALAARDLARATEALPADRLPVGWLDAEYGL